MEQVVKCSACGQHFMHTEVDTKCPFCHAEYVEVVKEKIVPKKLVVKTRKESFKMWDGDTNDTER